jgi:probable F420-dependent oxidoreductase
VKVWLSVSPLPLDGLAQLALRAEEVGVFGLAVGEHTSVPADVGSQHHGSHAPEVPQLDPQMEFPNPFVLASYLGSIAKRLHFSTHILVAPTRHPLLLAKEVATTAALLGGRLDLGVGLGYLREEYEAVGIPFPERAGRLDEMLPLLRALWTGEVVKHEGKYFSLDSVSIRPLPPARIAILVGGESSAALQRAVQFGDGWVGGICRLEVLENVAPRLAAARAHRDSGTGDFRENFVIRTAVRGRIDRQLVRQLDQVGVEELVVMPWQVTPGPLTATAVMQALPGFVERHLSSP